MSYTPLRETFRTLRFRLTLWNTTVVLVVVVLTLVGVREGLRLTLRHESDVMLRETLKEVWLSLDKKPANMPLAFEEVDRMAEAHAQHLVFVQMFDADGELWWASKNTPEIVLPIEGVPERLPVEEGKYRLLHRRLDIPSLPHVMVRVGMSPELQEKDLQLLTNILLAAGVFVLLLAPLGGYLLAGRATRPVARIIDTTSRLHPASMDERLPLRGTGDELDRLSQTINGLLDRIAAYIAQSREFTANAAHDLRSPLAAMQSSLEVALNAERSNEEYREILVVVLEECASLRTLSNQLLLLAETDSGRLLRDESIQMDQLVTKAVEMFRGVAETADIVLTVASLPAVTVKGNGNRLRQVVNNLVDNAIKFTPAKGEVRVELRVREPWSVLLRVADTGPGISPEDLPHIFERFFRGDKARRRETSPRGSGLGLAICRSVVEAHGGSIIVESELGVGTVFTVRLPQAGLSPHVPEVPAAPERSSVPAG